MKTFTSTPLLTTMRQEGLLDEDGTPIANPTTDCCWCGDLIETDEAFHAARLDDWCLTCYVAKDEEYEDLYVWLCGYGEPAEPVFLTSDHSPDHDCYGAPYGWV
ncbi:MAG: hypothetical protein FJ038_11675 [Chloroflexi bacterium]|nr:hypothetical protein [Chloroflexota bacterium]